MSQQTSTSPPVALVTGATSGIGRAVALKLAGDGAAVIVHGRDATRGAATVKAVEAAGGRARFAAADLGDAEDVARLAAAAGEVDVLVNNGGFSWFGPTAELSTATFDALFASNVRAAYQLVAALAPGMAARGHGSIISLDSMAGHVGLPGGAAYGATKAALSALSRSWAAEFSPAGVRVNTVAPGPVYTDGASPERIENLGRTTILGRAAQADEIAEVVAFLASDRPVTSPVRSSRPTAAGPRSDVPGHAPAGGDAGRDRRAAAPRPIRGRPGARRRPSPRPWCARPAQPRDRGPSRR